jgi:carbonic anhydrase
MKKSLLVLSAFALFSFTSCEQKATTNEKTESTASTEKVGDVLTEEERAKLSPDEIIADLKKGNDSFVNGTVIAYDHASQVKEAAKGQHPKAVILSCLDSRVPVEEIFNMSIGDLFVGRVAGNIEDQNMIGSFEFGTAVAGSKVIVVLGHSACGAVKHAIDKTDAASLGMKDLASLLGEINPAVVAALKPGEERSSTNKTLVSASVEKNVQMTINDIRTKSPTLKKLEQEGKLKIVGAVYDLETGKVTWL